MLKKLLALSLVGSLVLAGWDQARGALMAAIVNTKVSRVKSDQRSLATALESYYLDDGDRLLAQVQVSPASRSAQAISEERQKESARKIIHTGQIGITAKDTDATLVSIEKILAETGGHIAHLRASGEPEAKACDLTLRIPADRMDAARAAIKQLAVRILSERLDTQDVTDQFIDQEARMRALEVTESELLEILRESRERGRQVSEVMSIYSELTNVRSQIEAIRGRLNVLGDQVAFATLSVQLTPDETHAPVPVEVSPGWSASRIVRESAKSLVMILQALATIAIRATIIYLPIALVLIPPVYVCARVIALFRRRAAHQRVSAG